MIVHFPESPVIQAIGSPCDTEDLWMVKGGYYDSCSHTLIEDGFLFDGASIPKSFWKWIGHPLDNELIGPALLHDAKYAAQYCSRSQADKEFLHDMEVCHVSARRRRAIYLAVRLFGWVAWIKNSKWTYDYREFVKIKSVEDVQSKKGE